MSPAPPTFNAVLGAFVDAKGNPVVKKRGNRPAPVSPDGFKIDTRSVYDKDQVSVMAENRIVTKDADGFYTHNAGKKSLSLHPREVYAKGTHWRVVGENVRIEAMCNYGAGPNGAQIWSGWSRVLAVGTEVECLGWRRFRRDGLVAPQFTYSDLPAEARWSTLWPNDSVFRPWPLDGVLELMEVES